MKNLSMMLLLAFAVSCTSPSYTPKTAIDASNVATRGEASFAPTGANDNFGGTGEQTPSDPIPSATPTVAKPQERFVIHNASISISVKNVQTAIQKTEEITQQLGGFVVTSAKDGEATYFNPEDGYLTIRVPDPKLNDALNQIGALGKVTSRSVKGEDVTAQYTDLQLRLDNKEKMLVRLRELLSQAENTTVTLEVEKEINRVTLEIEQIKGTLIYLKDQFTFSTINVSVGKRHRPGPLGAVFYGIAWVVGKAFVLN